MTRSWTNWITGLCVALALLVALAAAFGIGRVSVTFPGLFAPVFASDADVRGQIEEMGIEIPSAASHLGYLRYGFEEPFVYITMEVVPEDRDRLFAAWLKSDRSKWSSVSSSEFGNYDPASLHLRNLDLSCFSFADASHVAGYSFTDDPRQYERAVLFEENGRKILLYYWHE